MNEKGKVSGPKVAPLTAAELKAFAAWSIPGDTISRLVVEVRRLRVELSALTVKLNTTVRADTVEADWKVGP